MASLLFLIGFILLIVSCCSSDDVSTRLVACYNKGGPLTASFDSFLSGKPPSLAIHKIWRTNSTKAGHAGTDDLTIVTAATLQRLDALKSQCKSYPGPVSAAVYIPLLVRHNLTAWRITDLSQAHRAVLSSASDLLDEAFQSSEQDSRSCHYHALMLVIEPVSDASIASLLPINALRNIALVAAATPLIAMVDVDLLLSSSLEGTLKQPSDDPLSSDSILKSSQGSNSKRPIAWILPAYETPKLLDLKDGIELVEQAVRGPKAGLGELIASGKIQSFASAFYPKGHACTDFRQWFNSTDPILVNYTVNCEPWFIISRHLCPFYDARFRGYGWNKVGLLIYQIQL